MGTSTEGQRLSTQRLPWVGSVGRGPLRNGRNARAVPWERCRQARHRRSLPTSRVSRRVDAGASNPSATNQVRPAHLDLKSIAKCKAHIGEALVRDPRLPPTTHAYVLLPPTTRSFVGAVTPCSLIPRFAGADTLHVTGLCTSAHLLAARLAPCACSAAACCSCRAACLACLPCGLLLACGFLRVACCL